MVKVRTSIYEPNQYEAGDFAPVSGEIGDATTFNATISNVAGSGLPDLAEPSETIRDKPVLALGENVPGTVNWQIDAGWAQDVSDGVITYGFFNHMHALGLNNNPSFGEGQGYSPFTEAQKAAARVAIQNWDDLIDAQFVEVAPSKGAKDWAQRTTDIWLANTTTGPAQAWAYYPGYDKQYERVSGDVWVADPRANGSNGQLDPGFYGLNTLNHELGHSLGLSHPGNYDFGDDTDGDGVADPITYEGDAFYYQDSNQYSIMSYFDAYETGSDQIDWNLMRFVYASTPMVHDIAVAQAKYGAEMSTRTGNTTYGFNSTADVTNAAMKFTANEMISIFSIWDAGGIDTLDLSGYNSNSIIDLREGAYSSAGGPGVQLSLAQVNANNTAAGLGLRTAAYDLYVGGRAGANEGIPWATIVNTDYVMDNNIGIAYGAIIENAVGGGGNDRINGNQADNRFTGNGGADTFIFAQYGADDRSVDTVTDFQTGVDKIDLTEFVGVNGAHVSFSGDTLRVDTNLDNDYTDVTDVTIIILGSDVAAGDYIFG